MNNPYTKNCNFCGQQIRMAEMENGQWLPFEIDGSGKHDCKKAPISRAAVNKIHSPVKHSNEDHLETIHPAQIKETFQQGDFEVFNNGSCFVPFTIMAILLIIICTWYFITSF